MANLKPTMGVSGNDGVADINDVVNELKATAETADQSGATKKLDINTDETEEKDVAIQMLAVFIDELGAAFAPYAPQAAEILLGHTNYYANESIRQACAESLPGLIKCYKLAGGLTPELVATAKQYQKNLFDAIKDEADPESKSYQIIAIKDIIDNVGENFMTQEEVDFLGAEMFNEIDLSLARIKDLAKIKEEEPEDEDEELDENDLE